MEKGQARLDTRPEPALSFGEQRLASAADEEHSADGSQASPLSSDAPGGWSLNEWLWDPVGMIARLMPPPDLLGSAAFAGARIAVRGGPVSERRGQRPACALLHALPQAGASE